MLEQEAHRTALIRRRIKFIVEKGAMARLFKRGTHAALKEELFLHVTPDRLAALRTPKEYDAWLLKTIELDCWGTYSRNGLGNDRWAYFAKLVNILVYEMVANRELFGESDWRRLRQFIHVPIDRIVSQRLSHIDPTFPAPDALKGMSKQQYLRIQRAIRALASRHGVPPIWFEAAWST